MTMLAAPQTSTLQVVAHGASSFSALNAFQAVVRGLPGVTEVRPRGFAGGAMHLTVEYAGIVPMQHHLHQRAGRQWRAIEATADGVEVWLN